MPDLPPRFRGNRGNDWAEPMVRLPPRLPMLLVAALVSWTCSHGGFSKERLRRYVWGWSAAIGRFIFASPLDSLVDQFRRCCVSCFVYFVGRTQKSHCNQIIVCLRWGFYYMFSSGQMAAILGYGPPGITCPKGWALCATYYQCVTLFSRINLTTRGVCQLAAVMLIASPTSGFEE